ncbi:MAG: hypothetical protein RMK57_08385 [Bryobacterales bacterium]|nr:hypothetical protein [Bryobacteraceae bacterium]MDW8354533.1 hypothetical protein [Bryobacterales bacterium]
MPRAAIRLALAAEFLLALIAIFTLWSQVGGQEHLDLMPWQWKLVLGGGLAAAVVQLTAAAIESERAWTARTLAWLVIALALMLLMGAATYYVHVQEPPEEAPTAETQRLSACLSGTAVGADPVAVR